MKDKTIKTLAMIHAIQQTVGTRKCPRCDFRGVPMIPLPGQDPEVRLARPGEATICHKCERVLIFFTDRLELREPTPEEYIALVNDEQTWDAILRRLEKLAAVKAEVKNIFPGMLE